MKNKKHIDELFKDSFQNFEATPSPEVWENIQTQLTKKKDDRKVIPIWWKLGGVAALLALLFTVGNSVFNSHLTEEPALSSEETTKSFETTTQPEKSLQEDPIYNTTVATEDPTGTGKSNAENVTINETTDNVINNKEQTLQQPRSNNAVASETNPKGASEKEMLRKNATLNNRITNNTQTQDAVAITSEVKKNKTINQIEPNTTNNSAVNAQTAIASEQNNATKNPTTSSGDLIKKELNITETTKVDAVAETTTEEAIESTNKKSLLEEIAKQNAEDAVAAAKEEPTDRWAVAPNVAPVYYNSLNGGSSIDPMFADNSQSGDVNLSYGIQVSYKVSNRLSVRTGVSNINVGYTTGGLELANSTESVALGALDYNGSGRVLTAFDKGTVARLDPFDDDFGDITAKAGGSNAELSQRIQYYEVPLELKYALLNKKVGIHFIGGLSTLFLGTNEVSVQAGSVDEVIGEANNLSSVSFSTNVGLGFDYKLSKKFTFNLEPMFKYQLNTYTDSSVDFRPYTLGVYTGLSFKF